MTAHLHKVSRPPIGAVSQMPLLGPARSIVLVDLLVNAFWADCEDCIERAVEDVVIDRTAFLVLRRACTLQETGQIRWVHGTPEGNVEARRVGQFDGLTLRQLTNAGARMWVARARLFQEIDRIGTCEGGLRWFQRPRTRRPGQRNRQR